MNRSCARPPHADESQLGVSRESTVSIAVVRGLMQVVEQAGFSTRPLLRAAQFDPEELDAEESRVSRSRVYVLCELAIDLTRDPALGLHWAERLGDTAFVPVSHLIAHSASLRQGFASLAQFYRLLSDQPSHELLECDDKASLRVLRLSGESPRIQRFVAEMMVAGFFRQIGRFSVHARPERVCFEYAAPAYHAEYARVFGAAVLFEQPFTGIVFDRALLDMPAPHKDADVHEALQALAERRLLRITQRTPYALRAHEFLVRKGWRQQADMSSVARSLGLSVRSLRRRLAAEGKSYNSIACEALASVAQNFLRNKQRSIQETAYEMGFSDASAFHRAFKRWTGMTPNAYRKAQSQERGLGTERA